MTVAEFILEFRKVFNHLEEFGLAVIGVYLDEEASPDDDNLHIGINKSTEDYDEVMQGKCHLSVMHPFIFDNRKIPENFLGVKVLNIVRADTFPPEIEDTIYDPAGFEMNYTPMQYQKYVQENLNEIRAILKDPHLTLTDALDAICMGDFSMYQAEFDEWRINRLIG